MKSSISINTPLPQLCLYIVLSILIQNVPYWLPTNTLSRNLLKKCINKPLCPSCFKSTQWNEMRIYQNRCLNCLFLYRRNYFSDSTFNCSAVYLQSLKTRVVFYNSLIKSSFLSFNPIFHTFKYILRAQTPSGHTYNISIQTTFGGTQLISISPTKCYHNRTFQASLVAQKNIC